MLHIAHHTFQALSAWSLSAQLAAFFAADPFYQGLVVWLSEMFTEQLRNL